MLRRIFFVAVFLLTASVAHANLGDCLQPSSDGPAATIRDCLYILQAGLGGSRTCETPCICDANADEAIDATDALTCLRSVLGLSTPALCSLCEPSASPFTTVTRGVAQFAADEYQICPTEMGFTIVLGTGNQGWVSFESPSIVPYVVEVEWQQGASGIDITAPDVTVSGVFQFDPYYIVDVGWHDLHIDVSDTDGDNIADTGSATVTVTCQYFGVLVDVDDAHAANFALAPDEQTPTLGLSSDQGLQPLYTFRDAVTANASRPLLASTLESGLALLVNGQAVAADVEPFGVSGPLASGATLDPVSPLPFDATISIGVHNVTDALGRPASFDGSAFQTVSDPGPITANPGFEGTGGWLGLGVSSSIGGFPPIEGQAYAFVGQGDQIFGYLDVPSDATALRFWAGLHEYLGCGGRPAEVTLETADATRFLFPPPNPPLEPCDDCTISDLIPWIEISTELESLRGQRVVLQAIASRFTECAPDLYEEIVLDDFRIE